MALKKNILVLGDSHASVFNNYLFKICFYNYFFKVVSVPGATISGIKNPNSKTNALNIFNNSLMEFKTKSDKEKRCIVLLGEVDTGFVLWYKHQNTNISIDDLLNITLNKYYLFLEELMSDGFSPIVISCPLPTIGDGVKFGEVANKRKEIIADQKSRTKLTLRFNNEVNKFCMQFPNINFINLDLACLNKNTGLVKKFFLNFSKSDHHYNSLSYSFLLIKYLSKYL